MEGKKPQISNIELGLVAGAAAVIDLVQLGLDLLFQIGVLVNRFLNIPVALGLLLYFWLRAPELLKDAKFLSSITGVFVLEEIPDVDVMPFWTLDVLYAIYVIKRNAAVEKMPGGKIIEKIVLKKGTSSKTNTTPIYNRESSTGNILRFRENVQNSGVKYREPKKDEDEDDLNKKAA